MANIVFLPGLLGSQLSDYGTLTGLPIVYWIGEGLLGSAGLDPLQLGPDGLTPGPLAQGIAVRPDQPLAVCYRPMCLWLAAQGHNVLSMGYDWRQALAVSAQAVAAAALAAYGDKPFWLVAHSMGGLVARLVWRQLTDAGKGGQIAGIITIGTPHYGSWEIVRLWGRLPLLYKGLALACGVYHGADPRDALAWIDSVVTTWPGAYQLMPDPTSGPLPLANPTLARALYTAPFYGSVNPLVAADWLQAAQSSWLALAAAVPPSGMTQIVGTGETTSYLLTGSNAINDPAAYLYTDDGDGEVAGMYARLPGVPTVTVAGEHGLLCLLPLVLAHVGAIVAGGS
jgi:pimeloyl-ACP methyl ester carboxylesterase